MSEPADPPALRVHYAQQTGVRDGKAWCEADDATVITDDEMDVTCAECSGFLARANRFGYFRDVDWFGERD